MTKITHAMVLAAGLGTRMRPLSEKTPKPLIPVAGTPMLARILERLEAAGVERAVINVHHLADQIEAYAEGRQGLAITISDERQNLLDTGGGVVKALPLLGDDPFFVVNGDVLWLDGLTPALERLAEAWDERIMDGLLLLHPGSAAIGYDGSGDFFMDQWGRLERRGAAKVAPFVFAGVQVLHPRLFAGCAAEPFSLTRLFDTAAEAERLYGLRHDGEWFHIGTPADLEIAEENLHHMENYTAQR